jgi:hypothetical protein
MTVVPHGERTTIGNGLSYKAENGVPHNENRQSDHHPAAKSPEDEDAGR